MRTPLFIIFDLTDWTLVCVINKKLLQKCNHPTFIDKSEIVESQVIYLSLDKYLCVCVCFLYHPQTPMRTKFKDESYVGQ